MIKMFSVFTEEVDDPTAAIAEIMGGLQGEENALMKNTVGLIHCYYEFIDNGVVEALSKKLPFDTIGITVPSICLANAHSESGFMLNILTSDDIEFVTANSGPLEPGNLKRPIDNLCNNLTASLRKGKTPSMLMAFGPFLHILGIDGDDVVEKIHSNIPEVPIFGALSFSDEIDFGKCYMLYNGKSYENTVGLVAFAGETSPAFATTSIPNKNIIGELAVVTKSTGNTINEINNMTTEDYVISLGIIEKKGELANLYTTPMIANLDDGSIIVRVCIDGDGLGGAVVGGHVPEGARIGFMLLDLPDLISTSSEISNIAIKNADRQNLFIYSCGARLGFLGANEMKLEAETICGIVKDSKNFFLAYSGGEIYPFRLPDGKYANHLQNYSIIICMI